MRSALRRYARRNLSPLLERYPAAYLAYERRRRPMTPVADSSTDIVIDGRPGCANSFAREAMLLANPGIRVASHVHNAAHVRGALRLHKPVVVLIRQPPDAIASEAARFDDVDIRERLVAFEHFYQRLMPCATDVVVAGFERVTSAFGDVVGEVNARFGMSFSPFPHDDPEAVQQVFQTLVDFNRSLGIEEGRAAVPGQVRSDRVARVHAALREPSLDPLLQRCQEVYERFAAFETATRPSR